MKLLRPINWAYSLSTTYASYSVHFRFIFLSSFSFLWFQLLVEQQTHTRIPAYFIFAHKTHNKRNMTTKRNIILPIVIQLHSIFDKGLTVLSVSSYCCCVYVCVSERARVVVVQKRRSLWRCNRGILAVKEYPNNSNANRKEEERLSIIIFYWLEQHLSGTNRRRHINFK